ncbi:hypothetical protein ACE1CI_01650 [Aerosakkonemataceae cyanobacterium BLCC-F50]|uniref:Uncharacterized protein n=1 Tax=Floridaenema flaviceps BLCC-F50 TaxID=3153642 RepID=A0ABV4XIT4_9CYAN
MCAKRISNQHRRVNTNLHSAIAHLSPSPKMRSPLSTHAESIVHFLDPEPRLVRVLDKWNIQLIMPRYLSGYSDSEIAIIAFSIPQLSYQY